MRRRTIVQHPDGKCSRRAVVIGVSDRHRVVGEDRIVRATITRRRIGGDVGVGQRVVGKGEAIGDLTRTAVEPDDLEGAIGRVAADGDRRCGRGCSELGNGEDSAADLDGLDAVRRKNIEAAGLNQRCRVAAGAIGEIGFRQGGVTAACGRCQVGDQSAVVGHPDRQRRRRDVTITILDRVGEDVLRDDRIAVEAGVDVGAILVEDQRAVIANHLEIVRGIRRGIGRHPSHGGDFATIGAQLVGDAVVGVGIAGSDVDTGQDIACGRHIRPENRVDIVDRVRAVVLEGQPDRGPGHGGRHIAVGIGDIGLDMDVADHGDGVVIIGSRRTSHGIVDRLELDQPELAGIVDIGGEHLLAAGKIIAGNAPQDARVRRIGEELDGNAAIRRRQAAVLTGEGGVRRPVRELVGDRGRLVRAGLRREEAGDRAGGNRMTELGQRQPADPCRQARRQRRRRVVGDVRIRGVVDQRAFVVPDLEWLDDGAFRPGNKDPEAFRAGNCGGAAAAGVDRDTVIVGDFETAEIGSAGDLDGIARIDALDEIADRRDAVGCVDNRDRPVGPVDADCGDRNPGVVGEVRRTRVVVFGRGNAECPQEDRGRAWPGGL